MPWGRNSLYRHRRHCAYPNPHGKFAPYLHLTAKQSSESDGAPLGCPLAPQPPECGEESGGSGPDGQPSGKGRCRHWWFSLLLPFFGWLRTLVFVATCLTATSADACWGPDVTKGAWLDQARTDFSTESAQACGDKNRA